MQFDAREMEQTELFRNLRDMLPEFDACIMIEVLVPDENTARRVMSFAKMSGYRSSRENKVNHYSVTLFGESCLSCG